MNIFDLCVARKPSLKVQFLSCRKINLTPGIGIIDVIETAQELLQDITRLAVYNTVSYLSRSICEDLPDVQWSEDLQEEDTCQETNPEPGLQRVVCVRPSSERERARQGPAGVHAAGLGPGH